MSTVEQKVISINMMNQGKYTAVLKRVNAPLSIQAMMKQLPLKGRALKQGTRLIMPTDLKIRQEKPRKEFHAGDVSIDPSSGNLSIHLETPSYTNTEENYLGCIQEEIETKGMVLSTGVLIKEIES